MNTSRFARKSFGLGSGGKATTWREDSRVRTAKTAPRAAPVIHAELPCLQSDPQMSSACKKMTGRGQANLCTSTQFCYVGYAGARTELSLVAAERNEEASGTPKVPTPTETTTNLASVMNSFTTYGRGKFRFQLPDAHAWTQ